MRSLEVKRFSTRSRAREAANHGDSVLINDANFLFALTITRTGRSDNCHDPINFMLDYMADGVEDENFPVHLPRVPAHVSKS